MADSCLLELLHAEIVKYVTSTSGKKGDLTTLEYLGFTTGYRFIERLTKDQPPFRNELEAVKFLCTDFWTAVYKKQIDNLKTNHHGVYVLHDHTLIFLSKLSTGKQYLESAPKYVTFTCGLLRGALSNLGVNSVVSAKVEQMPSCRFQIDVIRT